MAKILLVDDEPDIVYLLRKILERDGHEIVEAYGGAEALAKTHEEKPDLVLLDIMMPDLDGWDVSRNIKTNAETKDLPVIMVSVRQSEDSRRISFEYAHADAHIGKPASKAEILEAVNSMV